MKVDKCLFLIAVMFFASCKEGLKSDASMLKVSESNQRIEINIDVKTDILGINELIDSVSFIPLETSNECLIGEIDKIIYHESKYYILDCHSAKTLFCFDSSGHFLRKIGKVGNGPGEFVEPTDFLLTSSHIVVLDQFAHRLLFYTYDGEFVSSTQFQGKAHGIASLGNDSLFLVRAGDNRGTDFHNYPILVMDINGYVKMKGLENPYTMNYSASGSPIQRMNGRTLYMKPMADVIYEVTTEQIVERYFLNIKDSPLPSNYEKLCNGDFENFMRHYRGKYNYFSGQFFETKNHVFLMVLNKDNHKISTIYNKQTGRTTSGMLGVDGVELDFPIYALFALSSPLIEVGNRVVGYIEAHFVPNKTDENPFLVSFRFKE